jgi:type 1 glutamine amidotransferase
MAAQQVAALVGDYYHKPEPMQETLQQVGGSSGVEVRFFTDPTLLPWDSLRDFRALIMVKENRTMPAESNAVWATPKHEAAIAAFAAAGGALIGLHNGLASYDTDGAYFNTVRGSFQYHPKEHPRFQVRALGGATGGAPPGAPRGAEAAAHPLLAGFATFELTDEMYFVRVDSARTMRLLELFHPDYGNSCAAWAHTVGSGRVFCFTPGHTTEVLNNAGYRGFLERGLRWALRIEKS